VFFIVIVIVAVEIENQSLTIEVSSPQC
jgi:hypothetical protein